MQGEMNRGMVIAAIGAAVVLLGGLGWYLFLGSKPRPPADYKPVMPPGGSYSGAFRKPPPPR